MLFSAEAQKAAQFIQLANQPTPRCCSCRTPPATWSAREYEQGGIIKHGAHDDQRGVQLDGAAPTVNIGASYGAGNYGMCGRAYDPRFLFTWPNAKSAVMGPAQLAGVLSIVARQAAAAKGQPTTRRRTRRCGAMVEHQIEAESAGAVPVRAGCTTTA